MSDFFEAIRQFLLDYLPKQGCLSANTIRSYRQTLNLFVSWLRKEKEIPTAKIDFSCINSDVVLEFLSWFEDSRNCSASTRNQRLMALRSFLNYAGQMNCTQTALYLSALSIPSKKSPGKVVKALSDSVLTALLQQPNPSKKDLRNWVIMMLMYDTAARCGEILAMNICDLRLATEHPIAYLHGKGNKTRTVPLLPKTVRHCTQYLKKFHPHETAGSEAPLFYTVIHGTQQRMSPDPVAAFLNKYGKMAALKCTEVPPHIRPHMLRHSRAMNLYRAGMPLVLLSQYLGHAQAETTKIYAYADTEMKRAAIEKADAIRNGSPIPDEIWADDEDMILRFSGLI